VPQARRLLVTNHEAFGYFADRYGFKVVGALVPSVTTNASPSAQEMAALVERVRATGAPAVFLETGVNTQLAEQLAQETGVKVVTGLLTHSVSAAGGPAPTYLEMMRYNTTTIVTALK
jgi:ABC-type Zn uptake system ZnuABC Zn-binding protein ZnuA